MVKEEEVAAENLIDEIMVALVKGLLLKIKD